MLATTQKAEARGVKLVVDRRMVLSGFGAALVAPAAAQSPRAMDAKAVTSLARTAARSGRWFGTAVRPDQLSGEPLLQAALLRDCSHITPEIHMKWDALEPQDGGFAYAPADALVRLARDNDLAVRGHTLLWDQSTPGWAKARIARDRDWSLVRSHIGRTLDRYARHVHTWDVVNEPIDVAGRDGLRETVFHRAFGPGYVEQALRDARAVAPDARLMINDYGFDYENGEEQGRRRAFLSLLGSLRDSGAPLQGVGLQAHLDLSKGPIREEALARFLADLSSLDLEIDITELDVKEHDYGAPLEQRDRRVAAEVQRYLAVALDQPAVKGVTTWGLTDRYSWLEGPDARSVGGQSVASAPERLNRGLPYDAAFKPKPMYWAMQGALGGPSTLIA